jgi:hypothetical protein
MIQMAMKMNSRIASLSRKKKRGQHPPWPEDEQGNRRKLRDGNVIVVNPSERKMNYKFIEFLVKNIKSVQHRRIVSNVG